MRANWIYPSAAILCSIALWQVSISLFAIPAYLLPPPLLVLERLGSDFGFLLHHSWITTLETLGGFLLSIVIGIPLGILLVWSRTLAGATVNRIPLTNFPDTKVRFPGLNEQAAIAELRLDMLG